MILKRRFAFQNIAQIGKCSPQVLCTVAAATSLGFPCGQWVAAMVGMNRQED